MNEPQIIQQQRTVLRDLHVLVAECAKLEPQIEQDFKKRNEAAEKEFQENTRTVITRFETEKDTSQKEFQDTENKVAKRFKAERAAQEKELQEGHQRISAQFEADSQAAKNEFQKARSLLVKALESAGKKAEAQLEEAEGIVDEAREESKQLQEEASLLLRQWHQERDYGDVAEGVQPDRIYQDAFRHLEEARKVPKEQFEALQKLRLPNFFKGARPIIFFFIVLLVLAGIGAAIWGRQELVMGLSTGAGAGFILAGGLLLWFYFSAKSQIEEHYLPFLQGQAEVEMACQKSREQARTAHQKHTTSAQKRHDGDLEKVTEKFKAKKTAIQERRDAEWKQAQEKHDKDVVGSTQRKDTDLRTAHEKYQKLRTEIYSRYETDSQQIHQRHYKQMTDSKLRHESEWTALIARWRQGLEGAHAGIKEVQGESKRLYLDWADPGWNQWTPPAAVPPGIHFGEYDVDLAEFPGGLPKDERLKPRVPTRFSFPALLPFPSRSSFLIKTGEEGKAQALLLLQAVMMRYLTLLPPGKVRFTIIDPIGLGENFATFMHLADYDEALVNSRIWTEMPHIEHRLADLTAHMENVIQKYLRNEYETIEDYNAQAGEVAEPFRILVVANFPANFSQEAARRLISVVSSGSRCGVYALMNVDTTQILPHSFSLSALEQHTINLEWKDPEDRSELLKSEGAAAADFGQRFVWQDQDFQKFPLQIETPPAAEFSTRLLHVIGEKARAANRVEVPFDFIAPAAPQWWTGDTRGGVDVALGRAGATKRQHLMLGKGTAQHVLIAGKTGSGKSTLLHALITNLSLLYSPDEIELYLIDFKKGVEFETYAAHELPHARVVAIESDREFGLSILQRLDVELKLRGERFREAGAQDLRSYRDARGSARAPRILLIVDEFQEFFLEDDKVSQDAAQLLDRLVRQGRAFGLHVLLGSQTLGGAYSLARSTIDQMAVRIALQCSEADAQLILSDSNSAARLLSRPGEAIYNDANGLMEGNNPFQVVWLPEPRRETFLDQIREMDRKRNGNVARPQLVFEGNAPAEIRKNPLLSELLGAPAWPTSPLAYHAWLGEAMAIKDPTAAVFRRQSGANLLLVGQHDESARGILATALVSLAAQHTPADESGRTSSAKFYVLDGTPAEFPLAGYLTRVAELLPHPVQIVSYRNLPDVLAELAAEVERRQKSQEVEGATLYLFINGLHRFRDLRREEDDFGFSQSEEQKTSPAKLLTAILREGASLGVHTLIWGDTLNNVTRAFDRQVMREFEMRVLFQMSSNDSSALIDSPVASRLGPLRTFFHSEEEGRLEKFRPYGLPPEDWLQWMQSQLGRRASTVPVKETV